MSARKEIVLDLAKFGDKSVQVKLTGGRQLTRTLKGYDQLLNLVLDEAVEFFKSLFNKHNYEPYQNKLFLAYFIKLYPDDPLKTTDQTRNLGLIVSSPLQHHMSAKIAPYGS
ncbi:Sm-like protein LSM7 [Glycine max]|nr:Sm-like protein LSM7 [Glycine max]